MVIILYIVSPTLCEWFLGKGWGVSGDYIRILAPMFGVRFVTSALSPALIIVNKQKFEFLLQLLFLLFNLASYIVAKVFNLDIAGFLIIVNLLFSFAYALYLFMVFRYSNPKNNAWFIYLIILCKLPLQTLPQPPETARGGEGKKPTTLAGINWDKHIYLHWICNSTL